MVNDLNKEEAAKDSQSRKTLGGVCQMRGAVEGRRSEVHTGSL